MAEIGIRALKQNAAAGLALRSSWMEGERFPARAELLARHRPVLRYDSRERHVAISVKRWSATSPGERRRTPHWVYGHAAEGSDGRIWLSYWFFYAYNDYTLIGPFIGAGRHEGDWEMVQLRLAEDATTPDLALYTQHSHVAARDWDQVERQGAHPVIYVARGCHASYFSPGWHWTGVWFDRADGKGPPAPLELEVISDGDPSSHWVRWPGRWGATVPGHGLGQLLGLDASSPHGPGHQRQWRDPAKLLDGVKPRRPPRRRSARRASG
jgi:hypothetical protein